jgi:trans-aconitate methyltransferase
MYRWNPEDYSRNSAEQEKWALELIAKLDLKGDERVLDIGCGDGKVTAQIAGALPAGSVVGIDSSPGMIEHAKNTFADRLNNCTFVCLDAHEMDFEREFDIIFSNAALHWVHDHGPLLKRISRALRPTGRILLQMAGEGNASTVVAIVNRVIRIERWRPFFQDFTFPYAFYGDAEYRGLVEAAGLVVRRIKLIPKTMLHAGREGLAGWIRTTWLPYTQRVPEGLRHEFVDAIIAAYEAEHGVDDKGYFALPMMRLEVEAIKKAETEA